jgi:hypothetical protein
MPNYSHFPSNPGFIEYSLQFHGNSCIFYVIGITCKKRRKKFSGRKFTSVDGFRLSRPDYLINHTRPGLPGIGKCTGQQHMRISTLSQKKVYQARSHYRVQTVLFWLQMSRTVQQSSPEASTGILIEAHVKRRQLLIEVTS